MSAKSSPPWKNRKRSTACWPTSKPKDGNAGLQVCEYCGFLMTHKSKLEVWLVVAIVYVVAVLALGGNRWIGVPVLICLAVMAYPHRYVTAPDALRVSQGLVRWTIPYRAITFVRAAGSRVA